MDPLASPRILLVEDDLKLAALVREFLESNGLEVSWEARGDAAPGRILAEQPDLVVLDLNLPGLDGLEVCRRVRGEYRKPILMLTARGEELDEVLGLEIGADDYVAKPARPRVLLARIRSLLRRDARSEGAPPGAEGARLELGDLTIDAQRRSVHLAGEEVELTTAEFDLLWLLAARAGQVLSREQIYHELRGIDWDGLDRSVDLRVTRLRRKLGDDARHPRRIKSVRGAGYLYAVDPCDA